MKYRCYVTRVTLDYFEVEVDTAGESEAQKYAVARVLEDPARHQLGRHHQMIGVEEVRRL
jgi:hypothetical protein